MILFITRANTQATAGHWDLTSYGGKLDPTLFYQEGAKTFFLECFLCSSWLVTDRQRSVFVLFFSLFLKQN
jgi:hypothetical protein